MRHFDYRDEEVHKFSASALNLWGYFGMIIEAAFVKPPHSTATGLPCRRRPRRVPCSGVIQAEVHPAGNQLRWWCPVCGDNGQISNWEGTRWAPSAGPALTSMPSSAELLGRESASSLRLLAPKVIEGTIEWDEEQEGQLPKIVTTARKTFTWEELGKELMTYEGFPIRIKIGRA